MFEIMSGWNYLSLDKCPPILSLQLNLSSMEHPSSMFKNYDLANFIKEDFGSKSKREKTELRYFNALSRSLLTSWQMDYVERARIAHPIRQELSFD